MIPERPLPCSDKFASADEYVDALLAFVTGSDMFRLLCGGIHILDFWTSEPGHFHRVFPPEWRPFLISCPPLAFMDLLVRADLDNPSPASLPSAPPDSLLDYIRSVRRLCLARDFGPARPRLPALSRSLALGMNVKKKHEVLAFAGYIDRLVEDVRAVPDGPSNGPPNGSPVEISHLVDFGSGKNYLGRVLASDPYRRNVVALESRGGNILSAQKIDAMAGVAERDAVRRNKRAWVQKRLEHLPADKVSAKLTRKMQRARERPAAAAAAAADGAAEASAPDFRSAGELDVRYEPMEEGKGSIQYVEGRLEHGDLSRVVPKIRTFEPGRPLNLLAISLHSCGNLTNHAIRSLVLNPEIRAVAAVGCCYNQVTERLGPPTDNRLVSMRPWNGRPRHRSEELDPHGFPMSERVATYGGEGVRVNVTARMMACHAPLNWNEKNGDRSFRRHFYRSLLQRILLDRGVVRKVYSDDEMDQDSLADPPLASDGRVIGAAPIPIPPPPGPDKTETPFNTTTNPVNLGALPTASYTDFAAYVRGAIVKLTTNPEFGQYADVVSRKMAEVTDEEIADYEARYGPRKNELSAAWSLMAFSGQLIEALMVVDRWLFLREQESTGQCWVETVFEYQQSPRNLVVVGVKR